MGYSLIVKPRAYKILSAVEEKIGKNGMIGTADVLRRFDALRQIRLCNGPAAGILGNALQFH